MTKYVGQPDNDLKTLTVYNSFNGLLLHPAANRYKMAALPIGKTTINKINLRYEKITF